MFAAASYLQRRHQLAKQLGADGIALFLSNPESPMNYIDNVYPYRQDSNFLYFTGIDHPDFALIIDLATGKSTLFGDDLSLDHIVWMGTQPSVADRAKAADIAEYLPFADLTTTVQKAKAAGQNIHFLPPYRAENQWALSQLLTIPFEEIKTSASTALIKAVIGLRSYKSQEEIVEMTKAVNVTGIMHKSAMLSARAGQLEAAVAGIAEGIAVGANGRLSYPCIATKNGHILHNHHHDNVLQEGDLLLIDTGAETPSRYAGDITRTFPVSATFTEKQKAVYTIVLAAQEDAIRALKPGITFKEIHLISAKTTAAGLKKLGLMKGDVEEAVAAGAHALFFPHGLGHMIGLDVHDMEDLGEDLVGYDDTISRSDQFGLRSLRLGRKLESGFVITVEPGIYFIPALIERWKKDNLHPEFLNYDKIEEYLDFGGIRIEDNILITNDSYKILGDPIPKTIEDIEALRVQALSK